MNGLGLGGGPVARDIVGLLPRFLAVIGLLLIATLSLDLMTGHVPSFGGGGEGPARTPTPSNVVVVDPRAQVAGKLLYVKAGNVWVQADRKAVQVTSGGHDSMAAWAPDGRTIYFVRTTPKLGNWHADGVLREYQLQVPALMKVEAREGATPQMVLDGSITNGNLSWFFFIREPVVSPDGRTIALVTEGPDPSRSDVVLKFLDLSTGTLTDAKAPEIAPLGHQDPAWSPDGSQVLFVKNARDVNRGAPTIQRFDRATGKTTPVTGPGYLAPSWSPDARYIAATRSDPYGTDVVILDAATGSEVVRVTKDGRSFSPVWSPAGDAIAFYRADRGIVDLWVVKLSGSAPAWTLATPEPLTVAAGLDAGSRPAWFIPADQLPKPTPTPAATPSTAPVPGPS